MSRSSESHGTYQTVEEYNDAYKRRASIVDPRDATIAALQSEIARMRGLLDRARTWVPMPIRASNKRGTTPHDPSNGLWDAIVAALSAPDVTRRGE